jgi:hypothetical protein
MAAKPQIRLTPEEEVCARSRAAVCALASGLGGCITVLHRRPSTMHIPPQGAAHRGPRAFLLSLTRTRAVRSGNSAKSSSWWIAMTPTRFPSRLLGSWARLASRVLLTGTRTRAAQELQRLMATLSIHATPVSPLGDCTAVAHCRACAQEELDLMIEEIDTNKDGEIQFEGAHPSGPHSDAITFVPGPHAQSLLRSCRARCRRATRPTRSRRPSRCVHTGWAHPALLVRSCLL